MPSARAKCAAVAAHAVEAGNTLVQIVASSPDDETNDIYATLLSVLTYAQRSVDVTMAYFVPDDTLEKAIKDAAQRGVVVRIILPSYSDFSGVFYAGRAHYDELLESGVKLYELENAFLHSKSIVVDGVWSSIGSTNFDWRSFVHNNEISVCVIDEDFAGQMTQHVRHRPCRLEGNHAGHLEEARLPRAFQRVDVAADPILAVRPVQLAPVPIRRRPGARARRCARPSGCLLGIAQASFDLPLAMSQPASRRVSRSSNARADSLRTTCTRSDTPGRSRPRSTSRCSKARP